MKWTKDKNRHFSKDENTNRKQTYKKMLKFSSHAGHVNKHSNEGSPHPSENGYDTEIRNNKFWQGC